VEVLLEMSISSSEYPWVESELETLSGKIPVVKTDLLMSDRLGHWKVRWGMNRMTFRVQSGLYAVGSPDDSSPVFVSANYKLSFDMLRKNLKNINGWILVLDTKGVNVWCAAGKGTFGTDEIIKQVKETKLSDVVSHRRLIVPQLGAPGVAAHTVKENTDFKIHYGPVLAKDIPEYLDNKMKATDEMRRVRFNLLDRMLLVPVELVGFFKYFAILSIIAILLSGFGEGIYSFSNLGKIGISDIGIIILIYISITALSQVFLPWLPGRSFSLKGFWLGLMISGSLLKYRYDLLTNLSDIFNIIGISFVIIAVSSFITMNYTGSSTYTSLSGVRKEMKIAVPLQLVTVLLGTGLYLTSRFI
jgi:hypothetical protein